MEYSNFSFDGTYLKWDIVRNDGTVQRASIEWAFVPFSVQKSVLTLIGFAESETETRQLLNVFTCDVYKDPFSENEISFDFIKDLRTRENAKDVFAQMRSAIRESVDSKSRNAIKTAKANEKRNEQNGKQKPGNAFRNFNERDTDYDLLFKDKN